MKRFLIKCSCFCVILLLFALLFDYITTEGLHNAKDRKFGVWNDIYSGEINADIIALGSSRCWTTYNTYVLDSLLNVNSYNLGMDGQRIYMQIIRYDTYCRYNKAPKILLLNVDFLSTFSNSAMPQYEREQFFPYLNDDSLRDVVSNYANLSFVDCHMPFYRYLGYRDVIELGIESFFSPPKVHEMHKGYLGVDRKFDRASLNMDTVFVLPSDSYAVRTLDNFVRRVVKSGTHVVLVKSPVYYELFNKFQNISYSDSVFSAISSKYNCPLIDFYKSPLSLQIENFYNPSHMNLNGSTLFTTFLCDSLKKYDYFINFASQN